MRYITALILLPTLFPIPATAGDTKLRYFLSTPVIETMKFNGIEGRAEFAITPPDNARPLTQQQNELLEQYRDLNSKCRGGNPGPETVKACEQREAMNLRKFGMCYGLKKDQSMAEMEWHACRVSSNEYDVGSEYIGIACRPGESMSLTFGIQAPEGLSELVGGEGVVKLHEGELKVNYSVSKTTTEEGDRALIVYDFDGTGASLLRGVYEDHRVEFPIGSDSTLALSGSADQMLRDEIAHSYSICK